MTTAGWSCCGILLSMRAQQAVNC